MPAALRLLTATTSPARPLPELRPCQHRPADPCPLLDRLMDLTALEAQALADACPCRKGCPRCRAARSLALAATRLDRARAALVVKASALAAACAQLGTAAQDLAGALVAGGHTTVREAEVVAVEDSLLDRVVAASNAHNAALHRVKLAEDARDAAESRLYRAAQREGV